MIIAFGIWTIAAFVFAGIGISAGKSKKPVGFFTTVEPPKVTDVKKYNHAVSLLWINVIDLRRVSSKQITCSVNLSPRCTNRWVRHCIDGRFFTVMGCF